LQDFVSAHTRHVDVAEDDVGSLAAHGFDALAARSGEDGLVAGGRQYLGRDLAERLFVVDVDDASHAFASL